MAFFTVQSIGTGTADDPIRPDLPEGTAWVGQHDPDSGTYLILSQDVVAAPAVECDACDGTCTDCPTDSPCACGGQVDVAGWSAGETQLV